MCKVDQRKYIVKVSGGDLHLVSDTPVLMPCVTLGLPYTSLEGKGLPAWFTLSKRPFVLAW